MNKIKLLDCTLRDGGYCNNWIFGDKNINLIIESLVNAKVDIVECGFLTEKEESDTNRTKYTDLKQLDSIYASKLLNTKLVVMINYGEYNIDYLPLKDESLVEGIRLAFHKKDAFIALEEARKIKEKGYKVFLQPMISMNYKDDEFLDLIKKVNILEPYAFYIVDSFGTMMENDLLRYFFLSEYNLKDTIMLGFHSHNNLQMAFANSREFVQLSTDRTLIVDATIMGMGRGAGNLNLELFLDYINKRFPAQYNLKPILYIIDEVLTKFYMRKYWGYSLPNYLSARHNIHPNYAVYLESKQTLTLESMEYILKAINEEKAGSFDKKYIETLYINYMGKGSEYKNELIDFGTELREKHVLIIAPGKSLENELSKVKKFIAENNLTVIADNFNGSFLETDYIFISNQRRYRKLNNIDSNKIIITSNISDDNVLVKLNYKDLLIENEIIKDNSVLMLINYLYKNGVKDIVLAGVDGYSDKTENDYLSEMDIVLDATIAREKNIAIQKWIGYMSKFINIKTITHPKFIKISEV